MSADLPAPLLVSDREAAALCGLGRSTWHRARAAGKVPPAVRIGRNVRWNRAELVAWIESGCPDARTWAAMRATGKRLRVCP
jgi:excisionase family DNA binding protein